ncbi:putative DNA binding domain-containing protein [Candidatus Parcubacteria bacterium]|nr:putative DNA binding domain-containing protein [Candidatus Parcubacteria bacterium]
MDSVIAIIKKSPITIVAQFIVTELLATAAFILASSLAYYAQIYRSFSIAHLVSFQIAELVFVFVCQTILLLYIFARWHRECFIFVAQGIIFQKGVFSIEKNLVPYSNIKESVVSQSFLGKFLKYGTLNLSLKSGNSIAIHFLSEPREFLKLVSHARHNTLLPSALVPHTPLPLPQLLASEEHHNLEFKTTFRWDMREQKINRSLEKATMKTVAGFLNSNGGQLLIGVDDNKILVGLEHDFATLGKPNSDGFENHFSHVFNTMIGPSYRQYVTIQVAEHEGKHCGLVTVTPSSSPVYLKTDNSEEFFIRTGNGTTSLKLSETQSYIQSRFHL